MTTLIDRRKALFMAGGALAAASTSSLAKAAGDATATPPSLRVTVVNHVAVDIASPPDQVWRMICEEYVEAKKFSPVAKIKPLDDPAAALGGYHMLAERDGVVVDERIVHITKRDEEARSLSLFANYLTFPEDLRVFATYHAQQAPGGTRYAIDCHTRLTIPVPSSGTRQDVAAAINEIEAMNDKSLLDYLRSIAARLEGTA